MFVLKIAQNNLKANKIMTLPYFLASSIFTSFIYMLFSLDFNSSLARLTAATTLKILLNLGIFVIIFLTVIFLYYANSFLTRLRSKELGLYAVLGMDKKTIIEILALEEILVYVTSQISGLILGLAFAKLIFLVFHRLIGLNQKIIFHWEPRAMLITIGVMACIFLLIIIKNYHQVHKMNAQDLLQTSRISENNGKNPWVTGLFSFGLIIAGYIISLTTKSVGSSMHNFVVAAILVIFGIYGAFSSGSIMILRWLKQRTSYYYQPEHYTLIADMLYRMKRTAASLATICLLCTATLVTISGVSSLYAAEKQIINHMYARDVMVQVNKPQSAIYNHVQKLARANHLQVKNSNSLQLSQPIYGNKTNTGFKASNNSNVNYQLSVLKLHSFNQSTHQHWHLKNNEIILYIAHGNYQGKTFQINHQKYRVKKVFNHLPFTPTLDNSFLFNMYLVTDNLSTQQKIISENPNFVTVAGFNIQGSTNDKNNFSQQLKQHYETNNHNFLVSDRLTMTKMIMNMLGGIFLIGIVLSLIFIIITAFVLYYKQLSEGTEDWESYLTMRRLGMSAKQVQHTVQTQVFLTSLLPLLFAILNLLFALPVINKLLQTFTLFNSQVMIITASITVVAFIIFYAAIGWITSKNYLALVQPQNMQELGQGVNNE